MPSTSDFDDHQHPLRRHIWLKPPQSMEQATKHSRKRKRDGTENPETPTEQTPTDVDAVALQQRQTEYLARQNRRAKVLKELVESGVDMVVGAFSPLSSTVKEPLLEACHRYLNPGTLFT